MGSRLVVVEAFLGDLEAWFLTCNNPGGLSTRDNQLEINCVELRTKFNSFINFSAFAIWDRRVFQVPRLHPHI